MLEERRELWWLESPSAERCAYRFPGTRRLPWEEEAVSERPSKSLWILLEGPDRHIGSPGSIRNDHSRDNAARHRRIECHNLGRIGTFENRQFLQTRGPSGAFFDVGVLRH